MFSIVKALGFPIDSVSPCCSGTIVVDFNRRYKESELRKSERRGENAKDKSFLGRRNHKFSSGTKLKPVPTGL